MSYAADIKGVKGPQSINTFKYTNLILSYFRQTQDRYHVQEARWGLFLESVSTLYGNITTESTYVYIQSCILILQI